MLQPIVYLTCEIKGRDLDSRALIAAHLIKKGYAVVLGQYWNLMDNAAAAPKGCYFFKTPNQIQAKGMRFCKFHGHVVIASDEEAISSPEDLAATATDGLTFEFCDLFLALHEAHKRALLKAFPHARGKIEIAGSPRADILRGFEYPSPHEAPYVLFNTSFGMLNSVWKDPGLAQSAYRKGMSSDLTEAEKDRLISVRVDYEKAALRETKLLLDWFIARGDIDIVLRPHPSESAAVWRAIPAARLHVIENSDAYPWMQHAKVMIHSDSTTGVEATLMGTPSVNLSPLDAWADRLILRAINFSPRTATEAKPALAAFIAAGEGPIADAAYTDPLPLTSGAKTADAIVSLLPPPCELGLVPWTETPRGEPQRMKFTVSPAEFEVSLQRAFALIGGVPHRVDPLADSVVLVRPAA